MGSAYSLSEVARGTSPPFSSLSRYLLLSDPFCPLQETGAVLTAKTRFLGLWHLRTLRTNKRSQYTSPRGGAWWNPGTLLSSAESRSALKTISARLVDRPNTSVG